MIKKNKFKIAFFVISVIFIFIGYMAFSIWSFGNKSQLVKTDAAIVLGAAVWDNKPSPVLRERINHAIWLYDNNYVNKIIFTGGKGEESKYSESEISRDYAIKNDVSSDDIIIETKSRITEENIKYAYEIATEKNLKTFTIVSDPLHMKRAMLMAKNTGINAYSSPTPSSVYKTLNSQVPFLLRELFFYTGYILTLPFR